jgi:hypothetical protein
MRILVNEVLVDSGWLVERARDDSDALEGDCLVSRPNFGKGSKRVGRRAWANCLLGVGRKGGVGEVKVMRRV